MKRPPLIPIIIATGFGTGFWPWGPGTAGAILATLVWLALWATFQFVVLEVVVLLLIVLFTALGIWATAKLTPFWGDDPSRVVVDEMVGVWIALLMAVEWKTAIAALLLFRLFDIVKPLGIRSIDRRQGAFWVMADDIVAGIYAAVCMIPLYLIYTWVG